MGHEWVLWILVTASAMHVVEEHALGWQGWATGYIGTRIGAIPTWSDFWATNALLIVFGIAAGAMAFAVVMLAINPRLGYPDATELPEPAPSEGPAASGP